MERLDPEKNVFDIFIVDGSSTVQGSGEVVEAVFPQVHTIHRAENFSALFFDDISKMTEIKVSDICDSSFIFSITDYSFLFRFQYFYAGRNPKSKTYVPCV